MKLINHNKPAPKNEQPESFKMKVKEVYHILESYSNHNKKQKITT
jgi:hypothetical protein